MYSIGDVDIRKRENALPVAIERFLIKVRAIYSLYSNIKNDNFLLIFENEDMNKKRARA